MDSRLRTEVRTARRSRAVVDDRGYQPFEDILAEGLEKSTGEGDGVEERAGGA